MAVNIIVRTDLGGAQISVNRGTFVNEPVTARVSESNNVNVRARKEGQNDINTNIPKEALEEGKTFTVSFEAEPPPPGPATLTIRVLNNQNSQLLQGARVELIGETFKSTQSNGRVTFLLTTGNYEIIVTKTGFERLESTHEFNTARGDEEITLRLVPLAEPPPAQGELRVRILDGNLEPLPGARIVVAAVFKISGSDGRAVWRNLDPKEYAIVTTKDNFITDNRRLTVPAGGFVSEEIILLPETEPPPPPPGEEEPPEDEEPPTPPPGLPDFLAGLQQGIDDFFAGLFGNPWVAAYRDLLEFLADNFGINLAGPGQPENRVILFGVGAATPKFLQAGLTSAAEGNFSRTALTKAIAAINTAFETNQPALGREIAKLGTPTLLRLNTELGKTAAGRIALFNSTKAAAKWGTPTRSIVTHVRNTIVPFATVVAAVTLPIFAITEIPNLLNMMVFARFEVPGFISNRLKSWEDSMNTLFFDVNRAIQENRLDDARQLKNQIATIATQYTNYIENEEFEGKLVREIMDEFDMLEPSRVFVEVINSRLREIETRVGEPGEPPDGVDTKIIFTVEPSGFELAMPPFSQSAISPLTVNVPPGDYTGTISAPGHEQQTFRVFENQFPTANISVVLTQIEEEVPTNKGRVTYNAVDAETNNPLHVDWFKDGTLVKASSTFAEFEENTDTTFTIEAAHAGYDTATDTFTISEGLNPTQTLRLQPTPEADLPPGTTTGTLNISSLPDGARVAMFGASTGVVTPGELILAPGIHSVTLSKEGFENAIRVVVLNAGETKDLHVDLIATEAPPTPKPEVQTGFVLITSNPTAQVVRFGAVALNQTPGTLELPAGFQDLVLKAEGFQNRIVSVTIQPGATREINVTLTELAPPQEPKQHYVQPINSDPSGAKILVNGIFTGKWTPDVVRLNPGTYTFRLVKSRFDDFVATRTYPEFE